MSELDDILHSMRQAADYGALVPFVGAGVNMVGRQPGDWRECDLIPTADELRDDLVKQFALPAGELEQGLARVAQYVELRERGDSMLFRQLRSTFTRPYKPNAVHHFLARQPALCREAGKPNPWPMIITTNYDDALEQAFRHAGEPFDVVSHYADLQEPGCFRHARDGQPPVRIANPGMFQGFDDERCVILKLHGTIDRHDATNDSFVITEDHYASYLAHEAMNALPAPLVRHMRECHLLFLGYGLRDWNLRVIFMRIAATQLHRSGSWAIQDNPDAFDIALWNHRNVQLVKVRLEAWLVAMQSGPE